MYLLKLIFRSFESFVSHYLRLRPENSISNFFHYFERKYKILVLGIWVNEEMWKCLAEEIDGFHGFLTNFT